MIFSRNDTWFALFGHCCCFCYQGSGLFVHTASSPMGPWTLQSSPVSDISCQSPTSAEALLGGVPTPGQGCLYDNSNQVAVTRSQQVSAPPPLQLHLPPPPPPPPPLSHAHHLILTLLQDFVAKLPDGEGGFSFLYYGSRWGQSPDGIKGHEPQYVAPLVFNADGSLNHLTWQDKVTFSLE
jgi:hypothetical protein